MSSQIKPFMKWPGSKTRLAQYINAAFGKKCEGTFFSPFLGAGAAEIFRLSNNQAKKCIFSDVNSKIIRTWVGVQQDVKAVLKDLHTLPVVNFVPSYEPLRAEFNAGAATDTRHASLMIWLNHACYNGLYRENKNGTFNSPVGKYDHVSLPDDYNVQMVAQLIKNVEFRACDFGDAMKCAQAGDQLYCDPPYIPLSDTASFQQYSPEWLGLADQLRLAEIAKDTAKRGAIVVLTNHKTDYTINTLYPENSFTICSTHAINRTISCKGQKRGYVEEIIVRAK